MNDKLLRFQSFAIFLIAQCIPTQTIFFTMVTCLAAISSSRPSPITTYVTFFPNLDTILSKQLSLPDERKQSPIRTFHPTFFPTPKQRDASRFTCLCVNKISGSPCSLLGGAQWRQLEIHQALWIYKWEANSPRQCENCAHHLSFPRLLYFTVDRAIFKLLLI